MQSDSHGPADQEASSQQSKQASSEWRGLLRRHALDSAMGKRAAGVPTYSVPEAAALLSISQEYLYRLIQADGFPAIRMRSGRGHGRYVIPAKAVEQLLDAAASATSCVESADLAEAWRRKSGVVLGAHGAHGTAPPAYSHLDGEPLCPVMGPRGYQPADPVEIHAAAAVERAHQAVTEAPSAQVREVGEQAHREQLARWDAHSPAVVDDAADDGPAAGAW